MAHVATVAIANAGAQPVHESVNTAPIVVKSCHQTDEKHAGSVMQIAGRLITTGNE